ncbi:TipAS antibiotic-recognition domain-containing protein [Blautia sp.]|uniref:TipAS antibiotic-recognition domain-containing protein n=1 Tax=Blautia sp. TaxID=1955243 RepID=UPI002E78DC96|nr:TipAS antibiotic-recognition domain-containing protein [Blautia sp.]
MNDIFAEFAVCMKKGEEPNSDKTQNLVKRLQEHITENSPRITIIAPMKFWQVLVRCMLRINASRKI